MVSGRHTSEAATLKSGGERLGHFGVVHGHTGNHDDAGTVVELVIGKVTVHKAGGPPVRVVGTGEHLFVAVPVVRIVVHGHLHVDQVVVVGTVVVRGRDLNGTGFTGVNAEFATDEQETVLAFPRLNHPLGVIVGEASTPCVDVHNDHCRRPVVDDVEAEVSLPRVILDVVEVALGIPQVGNDAALGKCVGAADRRNRVIAAAGVAGGGGLLCGRDLFRGRRLGGARRTRLFRRGRD